MASIQKYLPISAKNALKKFRGWLLSFGIKRSNYPAAGEAEIRASENISVIIPVHDAPVVTKKCLASLEKFGEKAEIVIVDDCSKSDLVKNMLDDYCNRNRWQLIRHTTAQGHSRASEAGVNVSTRPYICLLNSDAMVTPNCWSAIAEAFETLPDVAIAGPLTSYTVGPQEISRASKCRHYWADWQIWSYAQDYVNNKPHSIRDADFVGGFAFFIRRSSWVEVGGFDTQLPDYGNEIELCKRIKKLGKRIVYVENSYVHHFGKESYESTLGMTKITKLRMQAEKYIKSKHSNSVQQENVSK